MKSKLILVTKEMCGWLIAIISSCFVLNILSFSFYHPAVEIKRSGGATPGLMIPGGWSLLGFEGYGIQTIDDNGYVNPDLPLEKEYYCVVGASHAEGLHSRKGERISDYLNIKFGYTDSLKFYNIAHTAYQFNNIAKHFNGIIQEFPNSKGIIIELDSTDYSIEQLTDALNQTSYSDTDDTIKYMLERQTFKDKLIADIKNYLPLIRELSFQYETYKTSKSKRIDDKVYRASDINVSETLAKDADFLESYQNALSTVMQLIRSEYQGPIIVVYHPTTSLDENGYLLLNSEVTDAIFEEECIKHDIVFIDMANKFSEAFYNDNIAVYGFWNTTLMTGHINKFCHELMADAVFDYLKSTGIE